MSTKKRIDRVADAAKLREHARRAPADPNNPKVREMPKVLSPEERVAKAEETDTAPDA